MKSFLCLIALSMSVSAFSAGTINRNGNCDLALLTNEKISGYNSELIQALIQKGYRPSEVNVNDLLKQAKKGDLVLEYNASISFDEKTCREEVKLVEIKNAEPVSTTILANQELKKKTYFGRTIKCQSSEKLVSVLPNCQ